MVIFKSEHPPIDPPTNITDWDWLFESPYSSLNSHPASSLAGFENAITKERLDWAQVKRYSTYISTALVKRHGLRESQTIFLFSQNTVWYPVCMFAGLRVGARVCGVSPAYNVEEMTFVLKTADAKFLLTTPASIEIARKSAAGVGLPESNVFLLEGELEGYTTVKELIEIGRSYGDDNQVPAFKIPAGMTNKDICGLLCFSSGTTGLPKAIMISHQNIIAQCLQVQQITPKTQKKIMAAFPLFHIPGLVLRMHLPIILNAEIIMLPRFSMESMLNTIAEYKITELLLIPPVLIRLVHDPIVDKYDLSHVTLLASGGAPLSSEIIQLLHQKFPRVGFKQNYGMTESCACVSAHPPSKYDYKYAQSVGTIISSTEIKIIKDDGAEANVGEQGEVLARGPQVAMGYLNNEKATRETFDQDGWLHTGDQGKMDADGMIYITDRIKELIKVKGVGVAPAELEDLLLGHPKVEDVAVMGIPDDYAGEFPKAFVKLKEGVAVDTAVGKQLLDFVREKKVKDKWIREVEFVDGIPKSSSGKILRRVLKERARGGGGGGVRVRDERRTKM